MVRQGNEMEGAVSGRHAAAAFAAPRPTSARFPPVIVSSRRVNVAACTEKWFTQTLDHFSWANDTTWEQRYFICDKDWTPGGPIFFYCGNEADVEGYVEHTGLMYENAASFGALLVFAEHRYYGQSLPLGARSYEIANLRFLTHEQALADYSTLILALKSDLGAPQADVIAFGGSYGGMLAAWFRMKYPHIVLGSIAASAPILAFPGADGGD